jgi:glycosyltransferase involved in cell wall biosynthesis
MNKAPAVSVVMSIYNGASSLSSTMDSILSQEDVDFEFIVVNDGSTDRSGAILDDYVRRDDRVRVIHQENTGLTRALIRGCAEARGKYIARQDAGDFSLPGRLARQFTLLESNSDVVMTSCGTRFVGPEGEFLYEIVQQGDELQQGLEQLRADRIRGPSSHPSTMFHRTAYQAVGGYRPQFQVAQDLDLWMRLAEVGSCIATPEVFYQACLTLGAISHARRREQLKVASTILQCAAIRRSGGDEKSILQQFMRDDHEAMRLWIPRSLQNAHFYYFVGSLLRQKQPARARMYYQRALKSWLLHPRALLGLWFLRGRP